VGDACSWCGLAVEDEAGFRAAELPGERRASFCRLEHVVPWFIQGPHWEAGTIATGREPESCSQCGAPLGEVRVLLVRHRGEHRIPDGFCSSQHLADWAKAGGRWR
jgi:hypothetical protein